MLNITMNFDIDTSKIYQSSVITWNIS